MEEAQLRDAAAASRSGARAGAAGGWGLCDVGVLRVTGRDAASFLHSQLTQDIAGLDEGAGAVAARVRRTGHLLGWGTVHRADATSYLWVGERADLPMVQADLDAFLFADDAVMTDVTASYTALWLFGAEAAAVGEAVFGPVGFEPWASLPEGAIRPLTRGRGGLRVPTGTWVVRRILTGDPSFLLLVPGDASEVTAALAARDGWLPTDTLAEVVERCRIEAGLVRPGVDQEKPRLLPESGLEQLAVSYTKGCYLGQEVIARVRTYGSVPFLLRGLVFDDPADVPEPGASIVVGGAPVGQAASAAWSTVLGAPLGLAWLDRSHRTPGRTLHLEVEGRTVAARVTLLPVYAVPDASARVALHYDRGIRRFAEGDPDGALEELAGALRLDPTFADAYEAIGVMLGRAGRFHEAIDFFRRLEEVAPGEPLVNTNLSLYYMKLGDKETAEAESGKAVAKNLARARGPGASIAEIEADQEAARLKDAHRKRSMFEKVLAFDPDDPIALFGLGNALSVLGAWGEAEPVCARAVAAQKNSSAPYLAHGKVLEKLDRVDEAIAVYRQGVEVASRKGDLMPLKEMEHRLLLLGASRAR